MQITKVIIREILVGHPRARALVSIVLDEALMLHDISLIEGRERWFLSFPGKLRGNGKFSDFYYPMDNALRFQLEQAAITAYQRVKHEQENKTID